MKKYLIWVRTEYKRAAVVLPSVFIKAVIAVILIGMVAFCGVKRVIGSKENPLVQIGYYAPNDPLTNLAVTYVEDMSSVKNWCTLIPMDSKAGLVALEQGEIAAFLMLPENVMDGILSGNNQPAQLYLSSKHAFLGQLFEELVTAGVGLLQTAQGEIYATHKLVMEFSLDGSKLEEMYQQIDDFNLHLAMNREQLFHTRTLSITENQSVMVYYVGALMALYLMFLTVLWGKHLKRSNTEMRICTQRLGISVWQQLAGRIGITWFMLTVCFLPVLALWLLPDIRHTLTIALSPSILLLIILSLTVTAVWLQLVSILGDNKQVIIWILVLTTIMGGYVSGFFIPSSLLPDAIKKVAAYLPTTYIRHSFSSLFSGVMEDYLQAALVLVGWVVILIGVCVFFSNHEETFLQVRKVESTRRNGSSILILTKRLLLKKSFFVCLLLTILLSWLTVKLEERSETTIYAGIYTEEEHLGSILKDRNGTVDFILFQSEEELKRNVMQGKLECGYVLQEGLQNQILSGNGNWSITVYEKSDSTMTMMVNEVLFERLFYDMTSKWYAGYIANSIFFETIKNDIGEDQLRNRAKEALSEKLTDDSTFRVLVNVPDGNHSATQNKKKVVTYPVWLIMICNILFCGIIGVKEYYTDRRLGRFPNRPACIMCFYTIMLPVCIALIVNFIIMVLTNK